MAKKNREKKKPKQDKKKQVAATSIAELSSQKRK